MEEKLTQSLLALTTLNLSAMRMKGEARDNGWESLAVTAFSSKQIEEI